MLETKKIRKLERLSKANTIKAKKSHKKATIKTMDKPLKISQAKPLAILDNDLAFVEKNGRIQSDFSFFNQFKHMTSVAIRNDLSEKLITVLLQNNSNSETKDWKEMSDKYSQAYSPAFQTMANSIKNYQLNCKQLIEDHDKTKKQMDYNMRVLQAQKSQFCAQKRLHWFETYPSFEIRYRLKEDQFKCTEMCFNESFIRESGYTIENFPNIVLTEGIPQFLHHDHEANIFNWHMILNCFTAEYKELPEFTTELFMKSGYAKKVTLQSFVMREVQGDDIIIGIVTIMNLKSLPHGSYQKIEYSEEFLHQLEQRDLEKEYMLNVYYQEPFKGLFSNRDKICQIRDLEE